MNHTHQSSSERYTYIDVLRGLAALFVVYQHTAELTLHAITHINSVERTIMEFFTNFIGMGEIGVCVFLMISGFVVPFSLFRFRSHPIKNFIAHRFFRLYPAYWLSVPLGLVFASWRFGPLGGAHGIDWLVVCANMSMFQAFLGMDDIMGQYWTLALELLFYAICVGLFAAKRLDSFKTLLTVLISLFLFREIARHIPDFSKHYFGTITSFRYLGFMFFGLMYRKWLLEGDRKALLPAIATLLITLFTFGLVNDFRSFMSGNIFAMKTELTQLIAIAIFVLCTLYYKPTGEAGKFLGKISYSIYLFHPVVFYPLYSYWFEHSSMQENPHIFIIMSMLLTIFVSYWIYRLVEEPCIAFGRRRFSGNIVKPGIDVANDQSLATAEAGYDSHA